MLFYHISKGITLWLSVTLMVATQLSYGQGQDVCDTLHFNNPSAEGPGYPSGWFNCQGTSNPQPGMFGCNTTPSHGQNFIGLHSSDAGGEIIHQELQQAMTPGQYYKLRFDLAVTPNWDNPPQWGGGGYGDHNGHVEVYASVSPCGMDQLIGSSPIIGSTDGWTSLEFEFFAQGPQQYITFVPYDEQGFWTYFGIDNLHNGHDCGCQETLSTSAEIELCQGESASIGGMTYAESGSYEQLLQSIHHCDSLIEVEVVVHPTYEHLDEVLLCAGQSYQGYTQSGNYTEQLQTINGCDSIIQLHLTIADVINTYDTLMLCQGETGVLANGIVVTGEGNYSDQFTASAGCDSVHTTVVNYYPNIVTQQKKLRCDNSDIVVGQSTYSQAGVYVDSLQSSLGCDSVVVTQIMDLQDNAILPEDEQLCIGDQVFIDLTEYEVDFMFWNDLFVPPFISLEQTGTHYLDLFWENCHVSDTIHVEFHSPPPASVDTTLCYDDELLVRMSHVGGLIAWEDGFSNDDLLIHYDTYEYAQVENACGSFDMSIEVLFEECECLLFIPNSFSPNGDGLNDSFGLEHDCDFVKYELVVYDRFGQVVFRSTDPVERWGGVMPNRENQYCPAGLYNWVVNYRAITPTGRYDFDLKMGSVTVIR